MKRIILKAREEARLLAGHPWVYDNEVARILGPQGPASLEPGETADVESAGKTYIGRALVNPHSKIIARIYSPSKEGIDKGFFKRRIRQALERRTSYDLHRESARIVFGEGDFLPGLIIDRFVGWEAREAAKEEGPLSFERAEATLGPPGSWLSMQFLSYGMDSRRDIIISALEEVLENLPLGKAARPLGRPQGIVEKSAASFREREGLIPREGLMAGTFPVGGILIHENRFPFGVDLVQGQKTGYFLDQKENRLNLQRWVQPGARVLDGCAYTGSFGIHAARFGAASICAVDSSAEALAQGMYNARLNAVADRFIPVEGDIFAVLRSYERDRERFDLIILDPPAFAKTRASLEGALRGYKEINLRSLKLLKKGGVLVSCSCSHAVDEGAFKTMVAEAARDAEARLQQLDFRYQAQDHPILIGYDESLYLKCGVYRVV
ncbi:MAG: class I SAM-dependent rRNA methyltransferase [Spirochaetaceae bacterium]|jgi:23S rRNA (cytosine1962-C5)-methyltransferase|nr:class I SAM-dependent rRNA methyltransferase [Spirochaetaceae bacterium]